MQRFEQPRPCRGARGQKTEGLLVFPQLRQPGLKHRQAAFLRNVLNRHVAEADNLNAQGVGRPVKDVDDVGIGPAEFDGVVPREAACVGHVEPEIAVRDENGPAVFADERMVDVQLLLDELELGARLWPEQSTSAASSSASFSERGGGGREGGCVRIQQDSGPRRKTRRLTERGS